MGTVSSMRAREILDSRGLPTLEVDVELTDGSVGRASIPSGKSTGTREAAEWRDNDPGRFGGKGVFGAIQHVQDVIFPEVRDRNISDQSEFDQTLIRLDGSPDKKRLGANAILGCSLAFARATAKSEHVSLTQHLAHLYGTKDLVFPVPMMNVINGGKHADSGISTQEFMLVPHGAPNVSEAVRMGAETYHALRAMLEKKGYRISIGDEGGFAPQLQSTEEALQFLTSAIEQAGYVPGQDLSLALDFAANDFYRDGMYEFEGHCWTADEMTEYCLTLTTRFPIVSIEDGLAEDDWDGWVPHTARMTKAGIQCVGDDIFVTNVDIFREGIDRGIANAILIKLNQIGSLTETFETMHLAKRSEYKTVISHRSGETDDPFISDFALATGAKQMKAGAPARGERVAKYNQLLRLHEEFGDIPLAKGLYRVRK